MEIEFKCRSFTMPELKSVGASNLIEGHRIILENPKVNKSNLHGFLQSSHISVHEMIEHFGVHHVVSEMLLYHRDLTLNSFEEFFKVAN